jgi:hypothetical protein
MVRTRTLVLAALIGLALTVAACGGSPTGPANFDINGTWSGFSAARSTSYTLQLSQQNSSVGGTWSDGGIHGGQITGSRSGAELTLTLNGGGATCSLSLTATITTSTRMDGTLAGINCVSNVGGPVTLVKS